MAVLADKEILQKKSDNIDNFVESYGSGRAVGANTPLEIQMEICNTRNVKKNISERTSPIPASVVLVERRRIS